MSRVTVFPNGQTLTSGALTQTAINTLLQVLTCQMLGIDPSIDLTAYSKVRLDWPTGGAPGWGIGDDVAFIRTTEEDDVYNRLRDRVIGPLNSTVLNSTDTYTRVWRVSYSFYGPNSFDNARLLKSSLLSLDFAHDTLANANLYLVTDIPATTRNPEKYQGQWWERCDLSVKLNELITETLTVSSIQSAEVLLYTERGLVTDLHE